VAAVAYTEELLARASAWASLPLEERRRPAGLAELAALYGDITSAPVSSCRQCQYSDYSAVVQAYVRQASRLFHPETMPDSNYTLAPGYENETFVHESFSQAVTADNLTDEAAEFFIKAGFEHAFVKKAQPKTSKPQEEPAKLTPKQQLQATYKELYNEDADDKVTSEQLKELIATKQAELDAQRD
jgi:hypothetical protein